MARVSAGALGIAVLVLATPLAIGMGVFYARDRVDCHAIALSGTAVVFWLWAVYKCIGGDQDYGAITFAVVLVALC